MWHVTRKSSISSLCPSRKEKGNSVCFSFFFGWHLTSLPERPKFPVGGALQNWKRNAAICYLRKEIFRSPHQRETNSHWKDWKLKSCFMRSNLLQARHNEGSISLCASSESRKVRGLDFSAPAFSLLLCFRLV